MSDEENIGLYEYIGGAAGCGKTWMARDRVRENPKAIRLTASTGIAAINLGDNEFNCSTINSLLWYYNTKGLEDAWTTGKLDLVIGRLRQSGVREIIIDEVSMMSGRQLDIICQALDFANKDLEFENKIGLTVIGDFCQLPPVAEKKEGFAFEADRWRRFTDSVTILSEIKRQTDLEFIEALRHVRRGNGEEAIGFFQPRIERLVDVDFEGTTIMAKNFEVDRFNALRLDRLDTEWVRWPSYRFDKQLTEWEKIPPVLDIKIDALVMILVNKTTRSFDPYTEKHHTEIEYANGDLGYLRDYNEERALVELMRNGKMVEVPYTVKENVLGLGDVTQEQYDEADRNHEEWLDGDRSEPLRPPYLAYDRQTEDIIGVVVGTCEHMPLRVAYATTCHKSQGLTLDRVQINLNAQFFSYGGMAYVGLSRARTAEGLRIVAGNERVFIRRCKTNPKVIQWL